MTAASSTQRKRADDSDDANTRRTPQQITSSYDTPVVSLSNHEGRYGGTLTTAPPHMGVEVSTTSPLDGPDTEVTCKWISAIRSGEPVRKPIGYRTLSSGRTANPAFTQLRALDMDKVRATVADYTDHAHTTPTSNH